MCREHCNRWHTIHHRCYHHMDDWHRHRYHMNFRHLLLYEILSLSGSSVCCETVHADLMPISQTCPRPGLPLPSWDVDVWRAGVDAPIMTLVIDKNNLPPRKGKGKGKKAIAWKLPDNIESLPKFGVQDKRRIVRARGKHICALVLVPCCWSQCIECWSDPPHSSVCLSPENKDGNILHV